LNLKHQTSNLKP